MKIVELSGGVGGARLARGLAAVDDVDLTVVVNVGDDAENHGLSICPDLDTVVYTLAGLEGPEGWGRREDTFDFNTELARFEVDNRFRLGDRDLALKVFRTVELSRGSSLSKATEAVARSFDLEPVIMPVSDDLLRTMVRLDDGWVTFQEYFVDRGHRDEVRALRFDGAESARPAPGVIEVIEAADAVIIGPSNPPLSIWPMLAVPGVRDAVAGHHRVFAVTPLIGGATIKGPADRVMKSLGLPPGNAGVLAAYEGLVDTLVIDTTDAADTAVLKGVTVIVTDIHIKEPSAARRLAAELVGR